MSDIHDYVLAQRPGSVERRVRCPLCADTRSPANRSDKTLSIRDDGSKILYHCWHCDEQGAIFKDEPAPPRKKTIVIERPTIKPVIEEAKRPVLSDDQMAFLEERGISMATAEKAGLFAWSAYFRKLQAEGPAVAFPYVDEGKIYSLKLRSTDVKDFSSVGARHTFFLQDKADPSLGPDLVITEGEMDALSCLEAGIPNAVSIPDGASGTASDAALKFIWMNMDFIKRFKRIILALDADQVGEGMVPEMLRRLGKARCWRVRYPDGCKDSNDVLLKYGPKVLADTIAGAAPMPIEGVMQIGAYEDKIVELQRQNFGPGDSTGLVTLDPYFTVCRGRLVVVTGFPNNGKSELVDNIIVNTIHKYGYRWAVWSPENTPEIYLIKLLEKSTGIPFFPGYGVQMTEEEIRDGVKFLNDHVVHLHDDESGSDIEHILERFEQCIQRFGIQAAVIDPFNFINPKEGEEVNTTMILKLLRRVKSFALSHDITIFFVAHPSKPQGNNRSYVPKGNDIFGSNAWYAVADFGLTSHYNEETTATDVHIWKVRHKWEGKRGQVPLGYDRSCGIYEDIFDAQAQGYEPKPTPKRGEVSKGKGGDWGF